MLDLKIQSIIFTYLLPSLLVLKFLYLLTHFSILKRLNLNRFHLCGSVCIPYLLLNFVSHLVHFFHAIKYIFPLGAEVRRPKQFKISFKFRVFSTYFNATMFNKVLISIFGCLGRAIYFWFVVPMFKILSL